MKKKRTATKLMSVLMVLAMLISTLAALPITVSAAEENVSKYAPTGTTLVSLDATVTISACTNERAGSENSYEMPSERWTKLLLTDGIIGNGGWSCQPYDREMDHTKPVTVTLELASKTDVSMVMLFPNGQFPAKYEIQLSTDGKTFKKVAEDAGVPINQSEPKTYTFAQTTAKFVRLHIIERNPATGRDGALAQLGEIAVFGNAKATLALDRTSLELFVGETDQLKPTFKGTTDTYPVTYKSSDTSVATIAADGTITPKKLGKTTITMTCAQLNQSVTCSVKVVDKKYSFDDNIMISIFWPPTPEYITDEQYKLIADAGVTWVLGAGEETLATVDNQAKMLALCEKYGLGMTVSDGNFGGSLLNKSEKQVADAVARYKNVPGAYGFYILDEPLNPNAYLKAYINLKKAAPDAYMHLNFLPSAAYGSEEIYQAQMNDWCRLTADAGYPLDYLMFDRYPFPLQAGAMDRAGFFKNVRSCYEVGLKNDVKTGLYIQTVCQEVAFRRPTDSEIRYEMYASLAFGYKQLSFFTWFTPVNRSEPFRDGIIAADGTPNAHYEAIKTINHEILAIGKTLVKCDALGVYFNGPDTYGQPAVPEDFFVKADKNDSVILSWMRHKETGRNYLMVVNNNYGAKQDVELTFDSAIKSLSEVSRTDGSLKALTMNGQKLSLTLAAGDAMFIALPESFDFYEASEGQPDATTNLVEDAMITAPSSVGSDGWYISCLQDGQRLSEGKGNGWRTENRRDSYIDIDLGRTLKFNRVDLYPAGGIFAYGKAFPADLKISVSNDGEAWVEVKSLTDLEITSPKGMKISIGEQEARYVRIDLLEIAQGAQYMAINEIEIYNDDGTVPAPEKFSLLDKDDETVVGYKEGENIAKGKETFFSSTTPAHYQVWGWDISYINDGKTGNGWTSNVGLNRTSTATEYVGINFGDLFAVEKIVLEDNGAFPEDYSVALSEDGLAWTVVHEVTGSQDYNSGHKLEIVLDSPVNARFVRVTGTKLRGGGNDGFLLQLGEIEAYGKPVCDKTVLQDAIDTFKAEGGDENAKELKDVMSALENPLLTQTQARDYAKKLLALVGKELPPAFPEDPEDPDTIVDPEDPEQPTEGESESVTEPEDTSSEPEQSIDGESDSVTEPAGSEEATAQETATTPVDNETSPVEDAGCASLVALTALSLLPLAWFALRKKED
ncbi:MAG: discoidin domain-containing protein [Clostridia bacterium]|nr:discoidin domain-containing protein [Clostridia bacterium]